MLENWIERHVGGDVREERVRLQYGRAASIVGVSANALLFAFKLLAGMLSGSVAITADAINNLSDASSSLVSLLGFKLADKPADEDHPYGHGRYEYLSGLMVAVNQGLYELDIGTDALPAGNFKTVWNLLFRQQPL